MGEEARMSETQIKPLAGTASPSQRGHSSNWDTTAGVGTVPAAELRPKSTYLKLMLAQTSMSLSRKTLRSLDLISCPRSPYTVSVSVSHRSSCR